MHCLYCGKSNFDHAPGCPFENVESQSSGEHMDRRTNFAAGKEDALNKIQEPRSNDASYMLGWQSGQNELSA